MHRLAIVATAVSGFLIAPAIGMEQHFGPFSVDNTRPEVIRLDGEIADTRAGDLRKALVAAPEATTLELDSPGGWVDVALDFAYIVHDRGLDTVVPSGSECYSACAYIFFAGAKRSVLGTLGVNQLTNESGTKPDIERARKVLANVLDAMQTFDVPKSVLSAMLRTPPDEMHVFSQAELVAYGYAAEIHASALLLEAGANGSTSAVPFSGTVVWSKGKDEQGTPTLVAAATIGDLLDVEFTLRRNLDEHLPAYALAEIAFTIGADFKYRGVKSLAGILVKNEELVQGEPLVGASARIVGNQYLFAFSGAADDTANNRAMLAGSSFLDLAIIYDTGKRAIVTLQLDESAQRIRDEVLAAWEGTSKPKSGSRTR